MNTLAGSRHRSDALALSVVVCLFVSACGGSPGSRVAQLGSTTVSTQSSSSPNSPTTNAQRLLAFSRCVRAHGVPNYPDPDSSGHVPGGKDIAHSSRGFPAAESACMHLLSSGVTQQQRQQKLAFGLKLARCMRRHGFPGFPDPSASSGGVPPGIDPSSPAFKKAQTTCQQQAQQAVGLP